jgi:DNA-directed RNA polymerase specialized sigma subunit
MARKTHLARDVAKFMVWRVQQQLREELGREPNDAEIAAVLGWKEQGTTMTAAQCRVADRYEDQEPDDPVPVDTFIRRNGGA